MNRSIIVEDEWLSAERMKKMVEESGRLSIDEVLYSVADAKSWLASHPHPDVIFLDIQLGDGTGFDILDHIESYPYIIFTTAFDEYTLKAFKYNSIDYLLKPIKQDELEAAIRKYEKLEGSHNLDVRIEDLRRELFKDYRSKFLIKIGHKYRPVQLPEVAYFFSSEGVTYLKTVSNESLILDHSLDEIETQVDPSLFFRVNRHLLIKGSQITSIDSYFNGRLILELDPSFEEDVVVSRPKVKSFKSWLGN